MAFESYRERGHEFDRQPVKMVLSDAAYERDLDAHATGTALNAEMSRALTKEIRGLNPDFKNVCIEVHRCDHYSLELILLGEGGAGRHGLDVYAETGRGYGNLINVGCEEAGRIMLTILKTDKLAELKGGVEGIIYHELGHYLFNYDEKGEARRESSDDVPQSAWAPEYFAELYALSKAKNAEKSLAAMLAMCAYASRRDVAGKLDSPVAPELMEKLNDREIEKAVTLSALGMKMLFKGALSNHWTEPFIDIKESKVRGFPLSTDATRRIVADAIEMLHALAYEDTGERLTKLQHTTALKRMLNYLELKI